MQSGELVRRFEPHTVSEEQTRRISRVRQVFLNYARELATLLPEGREESLVMTKLEEASFFAIAAISREGV